MKNQESQKQSDFNHLTITRSFLPLEKACEYLSLSKATLYSYTHKRVIPFYKPRGRKVYFKIEDLDNFILNETNRCKSVAEIQEEATNRILTNKKWGYYEKPHYREI